MLKVCCFKEIKIFKFVNKEEFLKSDDVKSNNENMMKCNDGIPSHHGSENVIL